MINSIVLIGAAIAGGLIYFAGAEDLEKILFINIRRNLLFPVFLIIILICGVWLTQYIHLSEITGRNSNSTQQVSIMTCWIENSGDCQTNANKLNNDSYAQLQNGTVTSVHLYLPFSMSDVLSRNAFSYFCLGILIIWGALYFKMLGVKE